MRILWRVDPKPRSIQNCGRAGATRSESNPRAAAPGPAAGIFHRPTFWFDFRKSGATFYFHDLVAQQRRALEFEVRRGLLHLLLQFSQQLCYIEIAAGLLNNRSRDFDSLDRLDVAMQVTHFQSDIAQIISQIFLCSLG